MLAFVLAIAGGISISFIMFLFMGNEDSLDNKTEKRLENIKNKASTDSSGPANAKKNIGVLIQDTEYSIKILGNFLNRYELSSKVKNMLKIAEIQIAVDVFFILSIAPAVPFLFFALINPSNALFLLAIAFILMFLPYMILKSKIKKRLQIFTQQLPEALGLIASSLRAGHSLPASFQMVVNEMPSPISTLFKMVVDDISLGRDTKEALDKMAQYMPDSIDLRFFITAVLIQREIGGNLAEILDKLNYTIRERFKLIGQLNSQTAQAKLSGIVLAVAPALIGVAIWVMNPAYMEPLFNTDIGKLSLFASVSMALMGFFVINKIVDIKI